MALWTGAEPVVSVYHCRFNNATYAQPCDGCTCSPDVPAAAEGGQRTWTIRKSGYGNSIYGPDTDGPVEVVPARSQDVERLVEALREIAFGGNGAGRTVTAPEYASSALAAFGEQ
jgi:hypothetical protein